MDTDCNKNNIIGHIAGIPDYLKTELNALITKSNLNKLIDIVDIDIMTSKIIDDKNMELLFNKYEYHMQRYQDKTLSQTENKISLTKTKQIEKKMFMYWKAKMEYYINKILTQNTKKTLLIGYVSFFKNHKINLNLNISSKFFLKVDHIDHAKSIIKYNLINSASDIINGEFDLNYLSIDFLVKKRIQLQNIYSKIHYVSMGLGQIINTLELLTQINLPDVLYYASFVKYNKIIKINQSSQFDLKLNTNINQICAYDKEWLALTSVLLTSDNLNKSNEDTTSTIIEKGIKNEKTYIKISNVQAKLLSQKAYIYEITQTDFFLPYPTKKNIYKYFTIRPIKVNRVLEIPNVLEQIKKLKIKVEIF